MSFPRAILIDNATYCNLRCSMCDYKNLRRKKQMLDFILYKKIINEIAEVNRDTRVWEIFVGDPCCCRDMGDRIAYAKSLGLTDVVLNTNGNALTQKRSREFIAAGLDIMYVGVDAVTQETYSKIRVGGSLEKVTNNVLAYRKELQLHGNENQKLYVQFLESDENRHEKNQFITLWRNNGISVKTRTRVSWGGLVSSPNLVTSIPRRACKWGSETMVICADGSVALCAVDAHCMVNCGNIHDTSIQNLWDGELAKYRMYHATGQFEKLPEFCRTCMDWQAGMCKYDPEIKE